MPSELRSFASRAFTVDPQLRHRETAVLFRTLVKF